MPDHTAVTKTLLYGLTEAYCKGERKALSLVQGDAFLGAMGFATAEGHEVGSLEHAGFVSGFLQALGTTFIDGDQITRRHITIDQNNLIIAITDNTP